jgi:peptidoglycan/LPS O-acetylase OafA/YrhL
VLAARIVEPDLLVDVDRQVVGAVTFSTNWVEISAGSDYFDDTTPKLFVTLWSLAVEEQFYLLWPIALLGLLALTRRHVIGARLAVGVALASALLMAVLYEPGANATRVYYGTDTHLFGVMLGVALAFCFAGDLGVLSRWRWLRLRQWVGFVALAGLVVLMLLVGSDSAFAYRGGILLASLLTVVVLATLPGPDSAFARMNEWRPLTWVGERSYGIYLWHWPVILIVVALLPAVEPGSDLPVTTAVIALLVTFGLAEASYRWLEVPVRQHGFGVLGDAARRFRPAAIGGAALLGLVVLSIVTAPDTTEAQRSVEEGERLMAEQQAAGLPAPSTTDPGSPGEGAPAWPEGEPVPPGDLIMAFGDSVVSGAAPALYSRFPGIFIDAEPIRQWRDAPAIVGGVVDAGAARPAVVLGFGTNAGLESDESQQALRDVLDRLGPASRVVLVNTVGVSDWVPSTNETLAAISSEYPNTIVADWHATVAENPGVLHDDQTHPNVEGIEVYADLVAGSFEELGPG